MLPQQRCRHGKGEILVSPLYTPLFFLPVSVVGWNSEVKVLIWKARIQTQGGQPHCDGRAERAKKCKEWFWKTSPGPVYQGLVEQPKFKELSKRESPWGTLWINVSPNSKSLIFISQSDFQERKPNLFPRLHPSPITWSHVAAWHLPRWIPFLRKVTQGCTASQLACL